MKNTRVQSLGWQDPLEEEMATHSSILACRILPSEEPSRLVSIGSQRVGRDKCELQGSSLHQLSPELVPNFIVIISHSFLLKRALKIA